MRVNGVSLVVLVIIAAVSCHGGARGSIDGALVVQLPDAEPIYPDGPSGGYYPLVGDIITVVVDASGGGRMVLFDCCEVIDSVIEEDGRMLKIIGPEPWCAHVWIVDDGTFEFQRCGGGY